MSNFTYTSRITTIVFLCLMVFTGLSAQEKKGIKQGGFQGDLSNQIHYVQKQIMDLESSIPADKFEWRPGDGVRSIGEVYLHIAFGNYILLKLAGYEPPADANFSMDMKKWDSQTAEKAKISTVLKNSFDHVHATLAKITDEDLEKKVNLFGNEMTLRSALMSELSHLHEHLGQSIAYSRMNNIVPPWTAAEQKAEKEKKENK